MTSGLADAPAPGRQASRERRRITVHGIVQGVGFRPFVNRLARLHRLAGAVHNFTGGVTIEVEGPPAALDAFADDLRNNPPPIAVIDALRVEHVPVTGQREFVITPSAEAAGGPILVSPDVAICPDCARELRDPADRRFGHPFINCTKCGPRFTIIRRVPYDRPHTTMAGFEMCEACACEYGDIDDRRYHAQPVACPLCGPRLTLAMTPASRADFEDECAAFARNPRESGGFGGTMSPRRGCGGGAPAPLTSEVALQHARRLLAEGRVVAIKGIGGFHLACDARNDAAVRRLRERKRREEKPLAVMTASLEVARGVAHVSGEAARLLTSPQAPIVLAAKAQPEALAPSVAPDSADYGLLLPYTPLHLLLFEGAPYDALVMTSGNLSDEPLCTANDEAVARLGDIADAFLLHDRDVLTGCDDSVVRVSSRGPIVMRRARGYVPFPVRLGHAVRTVLAVGAQLKNAFCLTSGNNAFLSQHMGDLDDARSLEFFERSVEHFESILQVSPEAVACDLHPDYLATRHARTLARGRGLPLVEVQHHHAHIVSCMADNHHAGAVIGLACDGTGLGEDGTVWGCEALLCDHASFRRVGHLLPVALPGGEAAIREPWRAALAFLHACGLADERGPLADAVGPERLADVEALLERGLNCPVASSAGRLFDAVSALLGLRLVSAYEGQAAMALEAAAQPTAEAYAHLIARHADEGAQWPTLIMDPTPMLEALLADLRAGVSVGEIAGRFHNGFAQMLADCAAEAARACGVGHVALSGGTFQNRILLGRVCDCLEERGLTPLHHRSVPPNDGGLALGQAVIADARLNA